MNKTSMKFTNTRVNRSMRYCIGIELVSGRPYLSIPVSNRLVDYEEYYEISKEMHDDYPSNIEAINAFAEKCRNRLCDHLLFLKPGSDRGVA
jgi:hypothetical protein